MEYARTAVSRFKLRKKYEFASEETAAAGNRKLRKSSGESCTFKKSNRKRRLCPIPGCMTVTDRLPQHLQRKHKFKIQSDPILSGTDPKRVYDRVRAEWRYTSDTENNGDVESATLPEEKETVNHRVERMFFSGADEEADSMPSTDVVSAADTTVMSRGVFSAAQVKTLVQIFSDMITSGAPISRPVIISRLARHQSFKEIDICQIVNRLKYERRQKREIGCKTEDV